MSKIKICGLRRAADIAYVNECRPDFIGFVFAPSKRQVSPTEAAQLRAALSDEIIPVGVFVNAPIADIEAICAAQTISMVQLHGDEDAHYVRAIQTRTACPVIKAVAVAEHFVAPDFGADYYLFDRQHVHNGQIERGGTGTSFDWTLLKDYHAPYFLAGGICLENLARALRILNPWCIDVSSGVETDGVKDLNKIRALISALRSD